MPLEPRIEAVRETYGLDKNDFWQIRQNGQWVCKHAALEVVAVKASIEWMPPQVIEADAPNLVTSMIVTGRMGDRLEWATGETNATNYSVKGKQPAYPWAMAEKRAKDRVILKLVGIHGLVYSEDEADDFKSPGEFVASAPKAQARDLHAVMLDKVREAGGKGRAALREYWTSEDFQSGWETLPADWRATLTEEKDAFLASYDKPTGGYVDPNDALDRAYADTMSA